MLVLIIDCGTESKDNICRILEYMSVPHKVVRLGETSEEIGCSHIIISGGSGHVYDNPDVVLPSWVTNSSIPVLGICYGMQLVSQSLGGVVARMNKYQNYVQKGVVYLDRNDEGKYEVWVNREDTVKELPVGFEATGTIDDGLGGISIGEATDNKRYWLTQYHPESPQAIHLPLFRDFLQL
jgi:GMP synthase (glutamine-hydrolysing)